MTHKNAVSYFGHNGHHFLTFIYKTKQKRVKVKVNNSKMLTSKREIILKLLPADEC